MNKRVSHQKTCLHYMNNISYNKKNQSRKKKSFSDFGFWSDFSFAKTDKVSVTSLSFFFFLNILNDLKSLNFQNCLERIMGCSSLGKHFRVNINISKFVSSYLHAERNLEVATYIIYRCFYLVFPNLLSVCFFPVDAISF